MPKNKKKYLFDSQPFITKIPLKKQQQQKNLNPLNAHPNANNKD